MFCYTIRMEHALGVTQHLTIKAYPYENRAMSWKSYLLYYGIWNDLAIAMQAKSVMVRNTSRYSCDETRLPTMVSVSAASSVKWQAEVGPFRSIDATLVAVPPSLC
ncbi:hypothetical protein B5M09_004220 [Aphanomyces astaci]|nr:hypothetical protein B5M09_004220 [Aphanomyces astaci]